MSLHRITAGSGYDYLTRQVAAMDSTERGHTALASYYTEKGEIPGRWIGSGMAGIDGLDAGDLVTAEQMQSLFGSGHHPLATQRAAALAGNPDATKQDVLDAIRLGQPSSGSRSPTSTAARSESLPHGCDARARPSRRIARPSSWWPCMRGPDRATVTGSTRGWTEFDGRVNAIVDFRVEPNGSRQHLRSPSRH